MIYIKLDDTWFDVTNYAKKHPGGEKILRKYHLKNATIAFDEIRGHVEAYNILSDYEIKDVKILKMIEDTIVIK